MILYFSGTGNTAHVARSVAALTSDKACLITETPSDIISQPGDRLIFCFPVYSWGVPPLVLDYIDSFDAKMVDTLKKNDIPVIMVCTCGDEVAETPEMFIKAWASKGIKVRGVWDVIMPNDYVLLPGFDVDDAQTEKRKLDSCEKRISRVAEKILSGEWETDVTRGSMPKLKSRLIYPLFRRWGINPRRWRYESQCVSCGRCAEVCPMHNITLEQGRPRWGSECVSCTACYHHCPVHAIEYGKITKGKGQYFCRLKPLKK